MQARTSLLNIYTQSEQSFRWQGTGSCTWIATTRESLRLYVTSRPGKGAGREGEETIMHTRTISMLLGAVLSTGVVLAQAPDQTQASSATQAKQNDSARSHHSANPDRMAKHLSKKLGLSSDQEAQIKPVLQDRVQKMQALRADTSL